MLIFGPFKACIGAIKIRSIKNEPYFIINYSSYSEEIPRSDRLIPVVPIKFGDDMQLLEAQYHEYLVTNPYCMRIIQTIVGCLKNNIDVYVCTISEDSQNEYLKWLDDCFASFFQKRYGYEAVFINEGEDILSFNQSDFKFSVPGILQADQDVQDMMMDVARSGIQTGDINLYDDENNPYEKFYYAYFPQKEYA